MADERERSAAIAQNELAISVLLLMALVTTTIWLIDSRVGLAIGAGLVGIAWLVVCLKRPLWSFNVLLLVFLVVYARLKLGGIEVEGPGNRGAIALGDVLWITMLVVWGARGFIPQNKLRLRIPVGRQLVPLLTMLPFVILATGLPVAGVLLGGWPVSYAIPGLRQLQWASFATLAYSMVRSYGPERVLQGITATVATAAFAHTIYGIVQLGYSVGWLSRTWVVLDDLFSKHNVDSWFYYPRLTGLLVNPNSYGLYGAFTLIVALAIIVVKAAPRRAVLAWTILMCGGFALFFSASRSALLGLGVSMAMIICAALLSPRLMSRILRVGVPLVMATFITFVVVSPIIPTILQERFFRFIQVFSEGVGADPNAVGRVDMWSDLWRIYITRYPFGTWVPTSYATGSAVDSFYVTTAVQGTPLFTLTWLGFLYGATVMGWRSYRRATVPLEGAAGLTVLGWSGIMAGSGLTLSPMLQPQLIVPLWTLIGVLLGCQRERRYSFADNIFNHRS
ncbi:MAG: O-antigen ligase family protein [bacterium]|jgi:hypothetical protein